MYGNSADLCNRFIQSQFLFNGRSIALVPSSPKLFTDSTGELNAATIFLIAVFLNRPEAITVFRNYL